MVTYHHQLRLVVQFFHRVEAQPENGTRAERMRSSSQFGAGLMTPPNARPKVSHL
jgi:hypothetical protein